MSEPYDGKGYVFGDDSIRHLATADERLQDIAAKVITIKDHSILKGHRPRAEQDDAFNSGNSKLRWPRGKHNAVPSLALDVQTYPRPPFEGDLRAEQFYLLGLYVGIGAEMGIELVTGADWDDDGEISDNGWDDLFHVEIVT